MENLPELKGRASRDIAAEKAGLGSGRTYEGGRKVVELGAPELVAAMDAGEVSINAAAVIAVEPQQRQTEILALPPAERRDAVRALRESQKAAGTHSHTQSVVDPPADQPPAPVDAVPSPATKRQERTEAAAKRRMIDALSQIRGHCRGMSELNASAIRHACTAEEIATWAEMARNAAKELRLFSAKLAAT
jgi:hypothetical protein